MATTNLSAGADVSAFSPIRRQYDVRGSLGVSVSVPPSTDLLTRIEVEVLLLHEDMAAAVQSRGGDPDDMEDAEERDEDPWWAGRSDGY